MNKPLRKLKFNSLFFRTFAALSLLALLLCIVFFCLISNFMYRNVKSNMRENYRSAALHYIDNVDREVQSLEQRLIQLANDSNVVNAAITPGINKKEHNDRNIQILSLLKNFARYNSLAESVILYEYSGDEIYTSDEQICLRDSYKYKDDLDRLLGSSGNYIDRNRYWNVSIRNMGDDRLYLCMEFLYSVKKPLSVLLVRLDTDYLFGIYSVEPTESIKVFDTNKETAIYGTASGEAEDMAGLQTKGDDLWIDDVYLKASTALGWLYVMRFDSGFVRLTLTQNLVSMVPVLLLLLLLALIFAWSSSALISRPVTSIINTILENDESTSERFHNARNEMEFLANEYRYTSQRESYMQSVLREISAEVLERTLLGLIEEKAEEEEVRRIIEHTGSAFRMDGKYCMILAGEEEGHDLAQPEYRVFTTAIEETAASFVRENGGEFIKLYKDGRLIGLAGFGNEESSRSIRSGMNSLYKKLQRIAANWPARIQFAISFVYSGIHSLPLAYRDTCADLETFEKAALLQEGIDFEDARKKKLAGLSRELKDGNIQAAQTIFHTLLNEIRDYENEEIRKASCGELIKIIAAEEDVNRIETSPPALHDQCTEALQSGAFPDLMALLEDYGSQVFAGIESANQRRQNRYVAKAKEYIELNFQNSSLSLSETADALDLNKSYLSTLMNEVLETGFTDYLNSVRIAKAREMLDNTGMSVNEICQATGFNSVQNFIRVFKKYVGMTPGQYRKQQDGT